MSKEYDEAMLEWARRIINKRVHTQELLEWLEELLEEKYNV